MIEKCKYCDSILKVDNEDLNIAFNFDIYYICPICYVKNTLLNNKKSIIKKLKKIKVRLTQIYDKMYLVN